MFRDKIRCAKISPEITAQWQITLCRATKLWQQRDQVKNVSFGVNTQLGIEEGHV